MVKVFYHNDPDGFCSAFWVRKYLENEKIEFNNDDFIEMNYDREFPWDIITRNEQVFMVDFSLNDPVDMIKLDNLCDFTWIDHHKTAIDKMNDLGSKNIIKGIRYDGIAACALTWGYFFNYENINKDHCFDLLPLFTQYIHLWDTWQWKYHDAKDSIEAFITYLMSINCDPTTSLWDGFVCNNTIGDVQLLRMIESGKYMISFRDGYGKTCCDSIGKTIEFEGYKCFACNIPKCNSEWFKSVDPSTYDILMPFYYNAQTEQFLVSLYSDKIDVSQIAVKYGGGGHCGASGFQCKQLPF